MSDGVRLDLNPKKVSESYGDIKGSENTNHGIPGEYKSYKYADSKGDSIPFTLSALLFGKKVLPGILPYPISVTSVITYFDGGEKRLLLVDLTVYDGSHKYYLNSDTNAEVGDVTFTEFAPKQFLDTNELGNILQNINTNNGFDIGKLITSSRNEVTKLVGGNTYLIFNLEKTSKKYNSDVTQGEVNVIDSGKVGTTYPKVEHMFGTNPFYIKGLRLKNNQYIKVKGGFPNEGLTGFNVYYSNNEKNNPLLVELKLKVLAIDGSRYIPGWYYLYKTTNETEWDILKVTGTSIEKTELQEILPKIPSENELEVENISQPTKDKLADLTKNLNIDLTQTTQSTGKYLSGKTHIDYEQGGQVDTYSMIRHASAFPSFTVKSINTDLGKINSKQLPPSATLLSKLNAYYSTSSYTELVLIELIGFHNPSLTGYPMHAYYYCKEEGKWVGYILSTTVGRRTTDMRSVINHIRQNNGKINIEKLNEQNLTNKLTMHTPDEKAKEENKSSEHNRSEKSTVQKVLEGFGGSSAGGGAAWEGYNLLLNPDRSLIMKLIRIFRLLL